MFVWTAFSKMSDSDVFSVSVGPNVSGCICFFIFLFRCPSVVVCQFSKTITVSFLFMGKGYPFLKIYFLYIYMYVCIIGALATTPETHVLSVRVLPNLSFCVSVFLSFCISMSVVVGLCFFPSDHTILHRTLEPPALQSEHNPWWSTLRNHNDKYFHKRLLLYYHHQRSSHYFLLQSALRYFYNLHC